MLGIFPGIANGGVVVRDIAGNCVGIDVPENAYCPPDAFTTTCAITFLPDNCTGRIMPSQINAIVSEMLCLGQTFDPDGEWDCESTCNLSALFAQWVVDHTPQTDGITIDGNGTPADRIRIIPLGTAEAICADADAKEALALCLTSTDEDNLIRPGTDGGMWAGLFTVGLSGAGTQASPLTFDGGNVALAVCDDPAAALDLSECVLAAINGDPVAKATLAQMVQEGICTNDAIGDALASCLRSTDAKNRLVLGTDGKLWSNARLDVDTTATIVAAATTDIGSLQAFSVDVTGNTGITSFGNVAGVPAGTLRLLRFTGTPTLTNSANLITPTGANITATANSAALVRYEGAGVWRILLWRGALATADWTTGTSTQPGTPTPAQIAAVVAGGAGGIGLGQTWQDVTASRATGTSYQNTTGKPIGWRMQVSVASGAGEMQVSTDNSTWVTVGAVVPDTNGAVRLDSGFTIVPPNHYYRYTVTAFGKWMELR